MEAKLRRMQLELRGQLANNEDRQKYDSYKSPIAASKKLELAQEKPLVKTDMEVSVSGKPGNPHKGLVAAPGVVASSNFDKIKNSKLFQKFIQKE